MKRALRTIACFAFVLCFVTLLPQFDPVAKGVLLVLAIAAAWYANWLAGRMLGKRLLQGDEWIDVFLYCPFWYVLIVWNTSVLALGAVVILLLAGLFLVLWLLDRADIRRAIRAGRGPKNSRTTQPRYRFDDD